MIFTIDRMQFNGEQLIAFEFYNIDKEKKNELYILEKVDVLNSLVEIGFDDFYFIKYKNDYSKFWIENKNKKIEYDYQEFSSWFIDMNKAANNKSMSKPLGEAREGDFDNYSAKILNDLYQPLFEGLDLSIDDNGLGLIKDVLKQQNQPTYGFDSDLFCSNGGYIIELLKRKNSYITNFTSHPARYPWNKHKFVSLWNAAQRFSTKLLALNYSENSDEALCLMVIKDFDTNMSNERMTLNEIAFKLENIKEFEEFLRQLEMGKNAVNEYIIQKPRENRDYNFFEAVYDDEYRNKDLKKRWNTKIIGKNFK